MNQVCCRGRLPAFRTARDGPGVHDRRHYLHNEPNLPNVSGSQKALYSFTRTAIKSDVTLLEETHGPRRSSVSRRPKRLDALESRGVQECIQRPTAINRNAARNLTHQRPVKLKDGQDGWLARCGELTAARERLRSRDVTVSSSGVGEVRINAARRA